MVVAGLVEDALERSQGGGQVGGGVFEGKYINLSNAAGRGWVGPGEYPAFEWRGDGFALDGDLVGGGAKDQLVDSDLLSLTTKHTKGTNMVTEGCNRL